MKLGCWINKLPHNNPYAAGGKIKIPEHFVFSVLLSLNAFYILLFQVQERETNELELMVCILKVARQFADVANIYAGIYYMNT